MLGPHGMDRTAQSGFLNVCHMRSSGFTGQYPTGEPGRETTDSNAARFSSDVGSITSAKRRRLSTQCS